MTLLKLQEREVHIWSTFTDEVLDASLLQTYESLLSQHEWSQNQILRIPAERHRHLVTRALVRTVLSRYIDRPPAAWRFTSNAYGRPAIANALPWPLNFNLTHTSGLIVMAVTRGPRAIGIDAECLRPQQSIIELSNHFFTPAETAALYTHPPSKQDEFFLSLWTLKESYIKARGMGLSHSLNNFGFDLTDNHTIRAWFEEDATTRWSFSQWQPSAKHIGALCVEQDSTETLFVTMRRTTPLATEDLAQCSWKRRSGPWLRHA